jgi:outer membrane receptor for ferrienterochelin and colicins
MITRYAFYLFIAMIPAQAFSQTDTGKINLLTEVVVTATRTEKSIGNLPVPLILISKKQIQETGFQKLSDILQQQAGLVLSSNPLGQSLQGYPNPFGTGVQLQGLDAGYTQVLLDGMPLTGRNAGILNLDRIAVNNIRQIEIIRGPAASLYGADALAGVINIITDNPEKNKSTLQINSASHQTLGASMQSAFVSKKAATQIFISGARSHGYDLDENIYGKTADPSENLNASATTRINLSTKTTFKNTVRYFSQKQFNNYMVYANQQPEIVSGSSVETDYGIFNEVATALNKKTKLTDRIYATGYLNHADVYLQKDHSLFDHSFLRQFLLKQELVLEMGKNDGHPVLAGMGADYEIINSSRYQGQKELNNFYGFLQKEFAPVEKLTIIAGARYDRHSLNKAQLNPRIAISYKVSGKTSVNFSAGTGFKTPDFRQQFLFFTNSLVGYTLLGANELSEGLQQLKQQGLIDPAINLDAYRSNPALLPEKSTGINTELKWSPNPACKMIAGFFRNDINNMIERYSLPFSKTNGQSIFSYQNISRVFTQGAYFSFQVRLIPAIRFSAAYQLLEAKDKSVIALLQKHAIIKRDPITYTSTITGMKDYGGLFNRSKHTASFQLNYHNQQGAFYCQFRGVYIGRSGYSDMNGNNILDDNREYTEGYTLLGLVFTKEIKKFMQWQFGADNLLAHMDKVRLPGLSGRTWFINCTIHLEKAFHIK